jgi:hypothetical protein
MLKTMFVLTVLSGHPSTSPVITSQHSTFERREKAFRDLNAQSARNTNSAGYSSTVMRSHACTETEVWVPEDEGAER